jgi:phage terminase small subunit
LRRWHAFEAKAAAYRRRDAPHRSIMKERKQTPSAASLNQPAAIEDLIEVKARGGFGESSGGRGHAAGRSEVSLERVLRELAAIAFSDISKAVTWGPSVQVREEEEDGQRVKVIVNAVLLVPSDKLDENTAAAIAAVSQGSNGAVRIKMHNKLAALVVLGKYLGMFDQRPQNSNVIYAISDEPMSAEEWKKQYVTDR